MRIAVLIIIAAVACGLATPAAAEPAIPTCLISNGGAGGHLTKTVTCVELLASGRSHAGSGRYTPGDQGQHTLTVIVEYQRLRLWVPVTSATSHGTGPLAVLTRSVPASPDGFWRACVMASGAGHVPGGTLCTSA